MDPSSFTTIAEVLKATGPYGLYVTWNLVALSEGNVIPRIVQL